MKKLLLTLTMVLGIAFGAFAQDAVALKNGGLFGRGSTPGDYDSRGSIMEGVPRIPNHGHGGNQDAPLGTGIAIMTALGAAYLVGKRRKEE